MQQGEWKCIGVVRLEQVGYLGGWEKSSHGDDDEMKVTHGAFTARQMRQSVALMTWNK